MRLAITVIAFLALSGCNSQPAGPPPTVDRPAACYSKPQCDAMWAESLVQVQNISGMRIQTATDSFVQTFNPIDYGRMSAMARKVPQPDGSTVIEATFTCSVCGNLAYQAVNLFTANVKRSGSSFGPVDMQSAAGGAAPASGASAQTLDKEAWQAQQIKKLQEANVSYEEYQKRYREIMGE